MRFKDNQGRQYTLSISIGGVRRVRDLLDVNLADPWEKWKDGLSILEGLAVDAILMIDVVYCLVKPECDSYEISSEQFGEAVDGEVLKAITETFWKVYRDFFQQSGRDDLATSVEKMETARNKAVLRVQQRIDGVDIDKALGNLFTDTPDTSEAASNT